MSNGSTAGVYNDTNNQWLWNAIHAAGTTLHYAGAGKIVTTSAGATVTGTLTATTDVSSSSDRRLKENIKYNESWSERVLKMSKLAVRYDWIDKDVDRPYDNIGFIAQDILDIAPEFVETFIKTSFVEYAADGATPINTEKEYYTLNYVKMIAPLYSAFGEQYEMVLENKTEIEKLKDKVLSLQEEVEQLKKWKDGTIDN